MHDASVCQALYCIDQIHGHNKKSVQVENDLSVFQIFVQCRAFREFVTQQAAIIENNINMNFDDIESLHTKKGEVYFHLFGTNGYHAKAKNETFTAASSRCRQNLKYENFTSSFARLSQKIALKGVPHTQHESFFSINQSNH